MMQYDIWSDSNIEGLLARVREAIAEGWQPLGGVAISSWTAHNEREGYDETQSEYAQAMVKP